MADRPGRRAAEEQIVKVCTDQVPGAIPLPQDLEQWNRDNTSQDHTAVFFMVGWVGDKDFLESMHTGPDRGVNPIYEVALSTFLAEGHSDKGYGPGSVGRAEARRRLQDTHERLQLRLESELNWDKGNTGILDVRYAGMTGEGVRDESTWPRLEYRFRFDVLLDVEV